MSEERKRKFDLIINALVEAAERDFEYTKAVFKSIRKQIGMKQG